MAASRLRRLVPGNLLPLRLTDRRRNLQDRLLAVTEENGVEEVGQRFGVVGAGTAPDDQRGAFAPVRGTKRNPAQFQHVQDIGIGEFVLEGEADNIHLRQTPSALQGGKGKVFPAELLLPVRPRGIDPLGCQPRLLLEHGVEDLEPQVAHPHLIDIGKGKDKADFTRCGGACPGFPAGVPGGFFHRQEVVGHGILHR